MEKDTYFKVFKELVLFTFDLHLIKSFMTFDLYKFYLKILHFPLSFKPKFVQCSYYFQFSHFKNRGFLAIFFYILFEFHIAFRTVLRNFRANNCTFNSAAHLFYIFSLRSFLEIFEQTTVLSIQMLSFFTFFPSAPS